MLVGTTTWLLSINDCILLFQVSLINVFRSRLEVCIHWHFLVPKHVKRVLDLKVADERPELLLPPIFAIKFFLLSSHLCLRSSLRAALRLQWFSVIFTILILVLLCRILRRRFVLWGGKSGGRGNFTVAERPLIETMSLLAVADTVNLACVCLFHLFLIGVLLAPRHSFTIFVS